MSLFYCPELVAAGPGTNQYYRAVGSDLDTMTRLGKDYGTRGVKIFLPAKKKTLSDRTVPKLLIPESLRSVLSSEDACPIPEEYLKVLYWLRKTDFVREMSSDVYDKPVRVKLDSELRARIVSLIFSGEWVGEPEHSALKKLNAQLEIFDLGRYRGLKPGAPIPEKYEKMRSNYQQYEKRQEAQTKKYKQEKKEEVKHTLQEEVETPFQRAMRLRRENGHEGF